MPSRSPTSASAPDRSSAATSMPLSSTGTGAISRPISRAERITSRWPGSSSPSRRVPACLRARTTGDLGEAVRDHDRLGPRRRASDAVEVGREGLANFRCAPPVEVAHAFCGHLDENAPEASQPGLTRELADIGPPVGEVEADGWLRRRGVRARRRQRDSGSDTGHAAGLAREIALRDELLVCLDDDAPRHRQLVGQGAGRRQADFGARRRLRTAARSALSSW